MGSETNMEIKGMTHEYFSDPDIRLFHIDCLREMPAEAVERKGRVIARGTSRI